MTRSVTHIHLKTGTAKEKSWRSDEMFDVNVGLCGETASIDSWFTEDVQRVNCPACNQKMGKQRLKDLAAAGDKIETESVGTSSFLRTPLANAKSMYTVHHNGELVAYVAISHGWGVNWRVYDIRYEVVKGGYHAKEMAFAAVPALIRDGKMRSPAVIRRQDEENTRWANEMRERERAKWEADRLAREAREARASETIETLQTMRERLGANLSNAEVDAVLTAIELLQKTIAPKKADAA